MQKRLQQWTVPFVWVAATLAAAYGSPAQGQVISAPDGTGTTVDQVGDRIDIIGGTQAGGNLFHSFEELSVGADETANFVSGSDVFNIVGRVSGQKPSYIDGQLQVSGSDANLYLINPSGVMFGPDAQLSLQGSFTATTADQVGFDEAWLDVYETGATDYSRLSADPSAFRFTANAPSAVVNQGDLAVTEGESLSLIGGNVLNTGSLKAPGGEIGLVAVGGQSTVRFGVPGSLLSLEVAEGDVPLGVGGGFSATALPALLTGSPGPLASNLVVNSDGSVFLGGVPTESEEVAISGEVSTRSEVADGGAIALLGNTIDLVDNAVLDASGVNGGTVLVGRGFVGQENLPVSTAVWSDATTEIRADGLAGAGGNIFFGADARAYVRGSLSAQGTTQGGFVETSADDVEISGLVNASGQTDGGRWLIDPVDIEIVSGATGFNQIDPTVIESSLDAGTDVSITTTVGTGGSGDIALSSSIDQLGGGTASLTLTGRRFSTNGSMIGLTSAGQLTFELNRVNPEAIASASSIESAIASIGNVNGNRLISLGAGTYDFAGPLSIGTQVEIVGAAANTTLLRDIGGRRVFDLTAAGNLFLHDLTFSTTAVSGFGGGIRNNGGILTVEDSLFSSNRAFKGGAIEVLNGASVSLVNSVLIGNSASSSGGAIHSVNGSHLDIVNSRIENNTAIGGEGGGLSISDGTATVSAGSIFQGNQSQYGGGGVFASSSTLTIGDISFANNSAGLGLGGIGDGGGLLAINGSFVDINSTLFSGNEASTDGGGVSLYASSVATIRGNSVFLGNRAGDDGGGIYLTDAGSILTVADTRLEGNHSGDMGGGLYASFDAIANLTSAVFDSNISDTLGGGAAIVKGATANFFNSTFNRNEAVDGGAIANNSTTGTLTLIQSRLDGNTAQGDGGGLFAGANSSTVIEGGTYSNNQTVGSGGGFYSAGELAIRDALVSGNSAQTHGGGLAIVGDGSLDLIDTVVENNTTTRYGAGLLLADNATAQLTGTLTTDTDGVATAATTRFEGNTAGNDGGGINTLGDSQLQVEGVLFQRNVSGDDGGAIAAVERSRIAIENSNFENNSATSDGGGVYKNNIHRTTPAGLTTATLINSRFMGNESVQLGGGFFLGATSGNAVVQNSLFRANQSVTGGGLYSAGDISLQGSEVVGNSAEMGGGLALTGSMATVEDTQVTGNTASFSGGGIAVDAANLTLRNSQVLNNQAVVDGGGVRLIYNGTATIESSELSDNRSDFGAGLELSVGSAATVVDSVFFNNEATLYGGGAQVDDGSRLVTTNTTFEGNRALEGGGILNRGKVESINSTFSANTANSDGGAIRTTGAEADLTLHNSTLSNNNAGRLGGGIAAINTRSARLLNTIVAGNNSATAADVSGAVVDEGNNLIGTVEGSTGFTNSRLVGTAAAPLNAQLAPLADNGGPTRTHLLKIDSPAINVGSSSSLALDQRGLARLVGAAVDIGAVELSVTEIPAGILNAIAPNQPTATIPISDPNLNPNLNPNTGLSPVFANLLPSLLSALQSAFSNLDASTDLGVQISANAQESRDNTTIRRLEQAFSQSFEDYWDLSTGTNLSFDNVQAILRRAQEEYKVNSAVIYAVFTPAEEIEESASRILRAEAEPAGDDILQLALVMPEGELVRYQLSVTRAEAEQQVRLFRSTASDPDDEFGYRPFSQQLYQWLLAPLENDLAAQGIQNLMYSLDRGLRTAPVSAMRDAAGFSLERYGISVVPSVGLMQADFPVRVRRSTVAMGVASFESESPLPAVPIELAMVENFVPISHTTLNEGTTLDALESVQALDQPGVLHLATHATFDPYSPDSSYIHLWNDSLSMKEFSDLDWAGSDLELLILSACSTAMSSPNAELGFAGLAAASGVDATVGSLWQVSDIGTLALMSEFYAQLESTDLRFEALRKAQLALLTGETRIKDGHLWTSRGEIELPAALDLPENATLEHPFFWSAFTMVGNPW